jgi:class 3 adenylate cyclase/tetratricopeptide (TPR) repeat protein
MNASESCDEDKQLEQAIAALEAQRAMLGNAVVDAAIDSMREKLAALMPVQPISPDLHGERRQATILLADVKGSTELAEQVDTETWVEIMNHVFHLLGDPIYRYGGEIDQYRGDGLVAFFGAKAAHEDDPERAVRAALAMQEAVKEYAAELKTSHDIDLLLRVGVNTGEVIAAEVGDRHRHSEDTAMGRAIALAARMESASQPGTVLVTASTYRLTRSLFEWLVLGEITVKGVSQPVTVYRPLTARAVEGKGRGIEGLSSPLVGRDEELGMLRKAVEDLHRGVGGIVTLVGEAGIGKSRLVAEVRKQTLAKDLSVQWVEGRCLSYGGSIAYLPWLGMLRSFLNVTPDAPPLTVRDALRGQVQTLCPDCFDAVYPYLCRLMSLPLEDGYEMIRNLRGESLRAEVFSAVQTLVEGTSRQQPLVIVCEDLHWADVTSLTLLERVLALTDRIPLLVLCVFRPEREHGCWQLKETAARLYHHRHTDLWLDALSADESGSLVGHLLRVEDLPDALRTKILDHAEGNPFYVEEIIRALIDDGAIVFGQNSGRWRATREIASIPIPDTLHGVLMARIDRLQEETRRVLRLASVIGRVFFYRVLAKIACEEAQLDTRLLTLQRQQLIRERARVPELEYIFKHELTREAAYNGLLKRERLIYHRQVAETLEQLFPEQADEQAGLLAHHWERAKEPEKAIEYLLRAGEQARLAYANVEAVDDYQRALALLDELAPDVSRSEWRLTALSELGKTYFLTSKLQEAEPLLREAIALGEQLAIPPRAMARLSYWLAEVMFWLDRRDEQVTAARRGLDLLGEDTDSLEATLMLFHIAVGRARHLEFPKLAGLQLDQRVQDLPYVPELGPVHIFVCFRYDRLKQIEMIQKWLQILRKQATVHHDLRALGETYSFSATVLAHQGDLQGAVSSLQRAAEIFAQIDYVRATVEIAVARMGLRLVRMGDLEFAKAHVRETFQTQSTTGNEWFIADVHLVLGLIAFCQGHIGEAEVAARKAIATLGRRRPDRYTRAVFLLGRVCAEKANYVEARICLEEAVDLLGFTWAERWGWEFKPFVPLGALEQVCPDTDTFCAFCDDFRARHPESANSAFVQYYLEPAWVTPVQANSIREDFAVDLSPTWQWADPFGDCSYIVDHGLEIRAANGRDLCHINYSAPRVLRPLSGNGVIQTVCVSALADRPAIGGLLLWIDERDYLQLVWGTEGNREVTLMGCIANQDMVIGRGCLPLAATLDDPARAYLRLERSGTRVDAFCSVDGEQWFTVGYATFAKGLIQVGLHAIGDINRMAYPGAYAEGTAIRFESFCLWKASS